MMSNSSTKGKELRSIIRNNVIRANQKTESFVYHWLGALAMLDVTYFAKFVGASDIISSVLSIG